MSGVSSCSGSSQNLLNYIAARGATAPDGEAGSPADAARNDATEALVRVLMDTVHISADARKLAGD